MEKRDWKTTIMTVVDILFVLILCFVILLTTMLVTKSSGSSEFTGYTISLPVLCGVVIFLVVYLGYMLKNSLKSLRHLVNKYFDAHPDKEVDE